MSVPLNAFTQAIEALLRTDSKQAVKYVSPALVVKATRVTYRAHGRRPRKGERSSEVVLTFGKPGYREREFIKACKKAGEPFPVKRVQLRAYPRRRAA